MVYRYVPFLINGNPYQFRYAFSFVQLKREKLPILGTMWQTGQSLSRLPREVRRSSMIETI